MERALAVCLYPVAGDWPSTGLALRTAAKLMRGGSVLPDVSAVPAQLALALESGMTLGAEYGTDAPEAELRSYLEALRGELLRLLGDR